MSEFELLVGEAVPQPPVKQSHGRYAALLDQARKANGEFVAIRAKDDESAKKLSSVASRLNLGKISGAAKGEFEARSSVKDRTLWVRLNTDFVASGSVSGGDVSEPVSPTAGTLSDTDPIPGLLSPPE